MSVSSLVRTIPWKICLTNRSNGSSSSLVESLTSASSATNSAISFSLSARWHWSSSASSASRITHVFILWDSFSIPPLEPRRLLASAANRSCSSAAQGTPLGDATWNDTWCPASAARAHPTNPISQVISASAAAIPPPSTRGCFVETPPHEWDREWRCHVSTGLASSLSSASSERALLARRSCLLGPASATRTISTRSRRRFSRSIPLMAALHASRTLTLLSRKSADRRSTDGADASER